MKHIHLKYREGAINKIWFRNKCHSTASAIKLWKDLLCIEERAR